MRAAEYSMGHLPKRTDEQQTITTAAPAAPKEDRGTAIFRMLGQRAKPLAALLGGKADLVEKFRRAAAAHYVALCGAGALERERMEACSLDSYVGACMDAAMDGLTPDGDDGWIVVRKDVATWTVSWRGMVKLATRASNVKSVRAEVVYRQEIERGGFDVDLAAEEQIKGHRPWYLLGVMEEPDEMDIVLAYAVAVVVDARGRTTRQSRILTGGEIDQRARMSGNPHDDQPSPVWTKHYRAMARKSAIRALMDWLPTPDAVWDSVRRDEARMLDTTEAAPRLAAVGPAAELAAGIRGQLAPPEDAAVAPAGSVRAAAKAATEAEGLPQGGEE